MIRQMCVELTKCIEYIESDTQKSLNELDGKRPLDKDFVTSEMGKDYHYKEILSHLGVIKEHVKMIVDHERQIGAKRTSKIDKDYIKKQVENFQQIGIVNKRTHKLVRPPETSSFQLLECWEKMLDQNNNGDSSDLVLSPLVPKRDRKVRKEGKVISETIDKFLDDTCDNAVVMQPVTENVLNSESEAEDEADTKPRIVGLILKNTLNVQS